MRQKAQPILIIVVFSVSISHIGAQQMKRNVIANGNFEERFKNCKARHEEDVENKVAKIYLESLDTLNVPISIKIGETVQLLSAGEFLKPTQTPSALVFSVEDRTGSAAIDQSGNLTGIVQGDFVIKICNTIDLAVKIVNATIMGYTSALSMDLRERTNISIYPNIVQSGEPIRILTNEAVGANITVYTISGAMINKKKNVFSIETVEFKQGIYLVVIKVEDKCKIEKFIIR